MVVLGLQGMFLPTPYGGPSIEWVKGHSFTMLYAATNFDSGMCSLFYHLCLDITQVLAMI